MQKSKFPLWALSAAMCMMLGANISVAADQVQAQQKTQAKSQKPEVIYGSQLMTKAERAEHRTKMRSLKTKEEREAFRAEHHQKMQERAREMGKTLPDMPPAQGSGACGGASGCCGGMHGGMQHGGAGAKEGAACSSGGCGGMMHGEKQPSETAPGSAAEPQGGAASGGHSH